MEIILTKLFAVALALSDVAGKTGTTEDAGRLSPAANDCQPGNFSVANLS
jgi:hypothetical protein